MADSTTMHVPSDTMERFKANKPFDSMSHGEFVDVLLDKYEECDQNDRGR